MSYAARGDLVTRFSENHIDELESMHDNGAAATEVALSDATDLIDSYLPFDQASFASSASVIKQKCCDIARYLMHMHQPTEEVTARYDAALKWLRDLSAGKVRLAVNPEIDAQQDALKHSKPRISISTGQAMGDSAFDRMVMPK